MAVPRSAAALVEQVEAEWMYLLEAGAPTGVRAELGMAAARIGGGVALAMRHDPSRYWNKALGFGFDEPVTADVIAQVCDFYRAQGAPQAVLQLAPSVLPGDWDDICAAHRLVPEGSWVKLGHDLAAVDPVDTDLRVAAVEAGDATEWASVLLRGFGMPEKGLLEMTAAVVGRPGFRCFAAWDGSEIVGVGNSFLHADTAALWAAATLPGRRGRGAHAALLAARLLDAKAAGCRMAVAETGVEEPGKRSPALQGLHKAGFAALYERRNWLWRPRSDRLDS